MATDRVSGIDNYEAGYIDKDNEVIVGLQTDAPLKRIVNPFVGVRMVHQSLEEYGFKLDESIDNHFSAYRKTHNQGVFDCYTKEIRAARSNGLLTGIPDAYGRGRIIGDYRRIALYGIDYLIEEKNADLDGLQGDMLDELVREREEVSEQIRALKAMKSMAARYGCDISKPAANFKEAVQWLYFGYLAAVKENNGAAMSLGRTSTFLENFKKYCAKMSIDTDAIQYENDEVMRPIYGDDYAIACCVSPMKVGKQMQFFGARANLAKTLLYAINGGVDERTGKLAVKGLKPITDEVLDFETVKKAYYDAMAIVAKLYVDAMNIIHVNHDKYAYEAGQMALHDTKVGRIMAFGIAGLSVAADSLSAIKYAKVKPIRNEQGIAVDFEIEGDFPKYGNDDDRVDDLAVDLTNKFMDELKKHPLYRGAMHSLSVLTITSNVVYGKKTGSTPDGRKIGEPLAPGANPMHGRDENGALASLNSVAKIPFLGVCQDGVSNTFSIVPDALGKTEESRIDNLSNILDGYFAQGAHHLNVNVLRRETLIDAMENPDNYPTLTIRVSGYAVNFTRLTRNQQLEVISRTFHQSM